MKKETLKAIDRDMALLYSDIAAVAQEHAIYARIAGDIKAHKLLGIDVILGLSEGEAINAESTNFQISLAFNLIQEEAVAYGKEYGKLLENEGASIIDGKKVPWLKDLVKTTRTDVADTINIGLKEGKSMPKISRELKEIMSKDINTMRIARTEVARIQSSGSVDRYKANNVKKMKWLCGGDPCEICQTYCNRIFDINEVPEIPVHPNCTCDKAPVITPEERKEIKERALAPEAVPKEKPIKPKVAVPKKVVPKEKPIKKAVPKEKPTKPGTTKEQLKEDKKVAKDLYDPTKKTGKEHGLVVDEKGNKYYAVGDKKSIKLKKPDDPRATFTSYHTHPVHPNGVPEGFSSADIQNFLIQNAERRKVVVTDKNIYVITKTAKTRSLSATERAAFPQRFKNMRAKELETFSPTYRRTLPSLTSSLQKVNRRLAKEYDCIYEIKPR